jgi:sterol desaturase/sphingolipid hydroxylase (fatty acid hydroxylase superfamily)
MIQFLGSHEPVLRLGAAISIALIMALWEVIAPRRPLSSPRGRRWTVNFAVIALNIGLVRLLLPAALVTGVAKVAAENGWGLLNGLPLPAGVDFAVALIALDLLIYGQHVAFHHWPPLWRLHRMHHIDLDIDFTTGLRFHPVESIISVLLKALAVIALGAPVAAVVAFEIMLNGTALFNHGNVRLPASVDRIIRLAIVTPDMHRVHHSVLRAETDSNFGFALSLWDRVFGTYRAQPRAGHDAMVIGQPGFRDAASQGLWALLTNPLQAETDPRP